MALRIYSPVFEDLFEDFDKMFAGHNQETVRKFVTDIYETENSGVIKMEVPGFSKEELSIKLDNNILTVSGERKQETSENTKYYLREIDYGKFARSFEIPEYLDSEKIKAKFENGVLKIEIEKRKEEQKKDISITIE